MSHLVVGDHLALARIQQPITFLEPGDDALDRVGKIIRRYLVGTSAGRQYRRLVDQVRKVCTGEAGS